MPAARPLAPAEVLLIEALARQSEGVDVSRLNGAEAISMDDGGMGSVLIDPGTPRLQPLTAIAMAEAKDEDGVVLSLCLFVDQDRQPRELDIWKVDFSPLIRLPVPSQLRSVEVEPRSTRR